METRKIVFGTAAFMGTEVKGHKYVIQALSRLKSAGITGIEYRCAGGGKSEGLKRLAESLGVGTQLRIDGQLAHEEITAWYDGLDVYILPSMTEGLNRSVIEAMSRALPVMCSDAGGNPELVAEDMMFHAGDSAQIAERMREMLSPDVREREARRSFARAHDFEKEKLDKKRGEFYSDFTGMMR